jgi:Thermolysin metallopeptidase, alpha-helical domain
MQKEQSMTYRISPYDDIQVYSPISNMIVVREDGLINPSAPKEEQEVGEILYKTARTVADFFWEKFRLCGIDREGKIPPFIIGFPEGQTGFSFGLNKFEFNNLDALQLEVVAHEYMHGVVAWLNPLGQSGQQGALDESLADVFAIVCKHLSYAKDDWNISDDRDLSKSVNIRKELRGIDRKNGEEYTEDNDFGYVHENSLFLSHAFYLVRKELGDFDRDYKISLSIWWKAFADLKDKSFNGFANKTIEVAYTQGKPWGDAVKKSWQIIGLV